MAQKLIMYVSTPTNNKLRIETMISSDDDDDEGDLWEDMRVNYNYSYSQNNRISFSNNSSHFLLHKIQ